MVYSQIEILAKKWLKSVECRVPFLLDYIRQRGALREAQIMAIEAYLYLKIKCGNRPLCKLFSDDFFNLTVDLSKIPISQTARDVIQSDKDAEALYEFARTKNGNDSKTMSALEKYIMDNAENIDFKSIIRKLFYSVGYTDYLFSLPMGAGKTFLMAAFIYIDLYFALNEPENKCFAHNFILLIPSGLKSSIVPSLKTIQNFDPTWVLPEPSASNIRRMLRFEILDQPKSAKKSNRAKNPNAQKIAHHQPFDSLMGLVMIVNAEKVILDRLDIDDKGELIEKSEEEKDKFANELRNLIGKIPNLAIHIDEVHHAAKDDIKLRQVVNKWNSKGSVTGVYGYSGTPYLSNPEKIPVDASLVLRLSQITSTVFYYPLTTAIENFLKKPRVEVARGFEPIEIIRKGVEDYLSHFGNKFYCNGCSAKLAIYCGSIERLEEEVFPFLTGEMKIPHENILKFHRGNKKHKLPKENELDFLSLDIPGTKASRDKKIILLVQIGKEGWDCRSLTGVILSQKGDSPSNMVLQTSCRCLRQVDKGQDEKAVIWLNEFNAEKLNKQLKDEQHTSIEELNKLEKSVMEGYINPVSRLEHLKLPALDFYQLRVKYDELDIEEDPSTHKKLTNIKSDKDKYTKSLSIQQRQFSSTMEENTQIFSIGNENACFEEWLLLISKESFGGVSVCELRKHRAILRDIFDFTTYEAGSNLYFNMVMNQKEIRSDIRLAFHRARELKTHSEVIPAQSLLVIVENLKPLPLHDRLYPDKDACSYILELDKNSRSAEEEQKRLDELFEKMKVDNPDLAGMFVKKSYDFAVYHKDRAFHYLPYNFFQSAFERNFFIEALKNVDIKNRNIEIYYNGDRFLSGFQIDCYAKPRKYWKHVGRYTPDFLMLSREKGNIHKVLIVETKGAGFAEQKSFQLRKNFLESEFIRMNNDKFGYDRFDFIYLPDDIPIDDNMRKLGSTISKFFI